MSDGTTTWRFPRAFWTGNAAELCERAAYYGTFIALRTYLIRVVGLDDVQAGVVAGMFGGWIYLVPFFTGAAADRMGFRKALMLAFGLLTVGYGTLGVFHTLGPVLVGLALIVLGGAFVKPVITGTVSKTSDSTNRARAFSIFYMVVNIGSFTGKTIVAPMRIQMGVETVPFFSAGAALLALILVFLVFRPPEDRMLDRPSTVDGDPAGHVDGDEQPALPRADPDHRRVLGDPGPALRLDARLRAAHGRRDLQARVVRQRQPAGGGAVRGRRHPDGAQRGSRRTRSWSP